MVWCPAVTILKLSVIFKQGAPHFHFVLGFANHGACPAEDRCQQISANPSRAWEGKLRLTGQTWWTRGPRVARGLLFPHLVLSIWQPHMHEDLEVEAMSLWVGLSALVLVTPNLALEQQNVLLLVTVWNSPTQCCLVNVAPLTWWWWGGYEMQEFCSSC